MNLAEIQEALDRVDSQAILFHGFTDYMRDYDIVTYSIPDPRTRIEPNYARFRFRDCVRAETTTRVRPAIWDRSFDDRLIDFDTAEGLDGYNWGYKWQEFAWGVLVPDSAVAREWTTATGRTFHEVHIEGNAHDLTLVFSDLVVDPLEDGYAPFIVGGENHYFPPIPLNEPPPHE